MYMCTYIHKSPNVHCSILNLPVHLIQLMMTKTILFTWLLTSCLKWRSKSLYGVGSPAELRTSPKPAKQHLVNNKNKIKPADKLIRRAFWQDFRKNHWIVGSEEWLFPQKFHFYSTCSKHSFHVSEIFVLLYFFLVRRQYFCRRMQRTRPFVPQSNEIRQIILRCLQQNTVVCRFSK